MDFDPDADWYCIERGTQEVAEKMRAKLEHDDIRLNSKVSAMRLNDWTIEFGSGANTNGTSKTTDATNEVTNTPMQTVTVETEDSSTSQTCTDVFNLH